MLILLVEDEVLVRRLASRALRSAGFEVLEAGAGDQALELLRERDDEITAIVSDVIMPGMTGPEFVRTAIEGGLGERPVLYISAFLSHPASAPVELPEGAPFLRKPFTSSQLVQKLRELLEGAGLSLPNRGKLLSFPGGNQ